MKTILLNLLKVFLGDILGEVLKKIFGNKDRTKMLDNLMGHLFKTVMLVEDLTALVLRLREQEVSLVEVREKVRQDFGVGISNKFIYDLEEHKSKAKLGLCRQLGKDALTEKGIEYTDNLINLAIELLIEKNK